MSNDEEEWRFIAGFGVQYSVSSEGRVRNNQTGSILSIMNNEPGSCAVVRLFNKRKRTEHSVAKLVWTSFNGEVPPKHVVYQNVPGEFALGNLELCLRGHLYLKGSKNARARKQRIVRKAITRKPEGIGIRS